MYPDSVMLSHPKPLSEEELLAQRRFVEQTQEEPDIPTEEKKEEQAKNGKE